MKHLIALLLLTLSFGTLAEAPPPANAFRGVVYGYEIAIYVEVIFPGSQYGLRTIYKVDGGWTYLVEPDFYEENVNTQAKADAEFIRMISEINLAAYEQLQDISLEPSSGVERIQWSLENKTATVDNEIIVN